MHLYRVLKKLAKSLLRDAPHPVLDGIPRPDADQMCSSIYDAVIEGTFLKHDEGYVRGRFADALRERGVIEKVVGTQELRSARILDVGGGNGAFELALSSAGYFVVSVETLWNPTLIEMRRRGARVRRVIAAAEQLPFRDAAFELITIHDALEHFRNPRAVGSAVMRALATPGRVFITTPARLRYLLRRDPHYNIPFLIALPTRLQQRLVRARGYSDLYHTERIYWSAGGIRRLFPGARLELVLSRWKVFRSLLFDEIVLRKG